MNDVEQYLKRATRGLWGRRRREVREELEAHISERITVHRIAGLSEKNAVERTLSEIGKPEEVNVGMAKIYTVPWVAGSGVFLATICTVAVIALSDSLAQSLPMDYRWPAEICLEASERTLPEKCKTDEPWLSTAEIRESLEPLGVAVAEQEDALVLTFPGAQPVRLTPPDIDPANYGLSEETLSTLVERERLREDYYPLFTLINEIASQAEVPVKLEGWNNPVLQVGNTTFQLGTPEQPLQTNVFHAGILTAFILNQPTFPNFIDAVEQVHIAWDEGNERPTYRFEQQRLEVSAGEGDRYLLMAWLEPVLGDPILWYDIAQANADGTVNLRFPDEVMFVTKVYEKPALNTGVLVRFTDTFVPQEVAAERRWDEVMGLDYTIIPPQKIQRQ